MTETHDKTLIKFKQCAFDYLRRALLKDLSNEHFAILLGKCEVINDTTVINVIDCRLVPATSYISRSRAHLSLDKNFIKQMLVEVQDRFDVDTIIDVHTHPFSSDAVGFSGVDDRDEKAFLKFIDKHFESLNYASIVLSQTEYSARIWRLIKKKPTFEVARIKTQTHIERIPSSDLRDCLDTDDMFTERNAFLNRSTLALGLKTMRSITKDQLITIVGVGGLGSIIAENLVHLGFRQIVLIDHDAVEFSNLNRIVGAYFSDAEENTLKVDAIKRHLMNINPEVQVTALANDVHDPLVEETIARSDWIFVATDNHSSRYKAQELSVKYFVPLISVGVNITVRDGVVMDMSGEVIVARIGDNLCLNCLGRINQTKVHFDLLPDETIKETLVQRGYVSGEDIKEPAVKTLNSFLSNIAVETLLNQFTMRQRHRSITVYENNHTMCISEDTSSVENRNLDCMYCNV
jgi:molybdopterin/thiamine biosynthesis adenylyltransferase